MVNKISKGISFCVDVQWTGKCGVPTVHEGLLLLEVGGKMTWRENGDIVDGETS